jgi:hypothetical protein
MKKKRFLLFIIAIFSIDGCCDKNERADVQGSELSTKIDDKKQDKKLVVTSSGKKSIYHLDGVGELPAEDYDKLYKESKIVMRGLLVYSMPYSSFTSTINNDVVDFSLCCQMFKVMPYENKGSWPGAGILIEDRDISEGQENYKHFYEIGDEYLLFLQGDTPIESEIIKVRRMTVHGLKILK